MVMVRVRVRVRVGFQPSSFIHPVNTTNNKMKVELALPNA
jgi:hypothetical protein